MLLVARRGKKICNLLCAVKTLFMLGNKENQFLFHQPFTSLMTSTPRSDPAVNRGNQGFLRSSQSHQHAEKLEMELRLYKNRTEELDDALHRAVLGHARMVKHYADLQEKYNDLEGKHRAIMEGIKEVKRAAAKAGKKGGTRFAKSLSAELSSLRVVREREREREREFLKKESKGLKIQLRDTAEAVHAAGESG